MVIPEYQDGKTDEAFVLLKTFKEPTENENAQTRKAGGQEADAEAEVIPKIIVDMREFRSDLPCLIHKRGIEVVPVTITVRNLKIFYSLEPFRTPLIADRRLHLNAGNLCGT